jgi:hypothetical protein
VQLLCGGCGVGDRQLGGELPVDAQTVLRLVRLSGIQDRQVEHRILECISSLQAVYTRAPLPVIAAVVLVRSSDLVGTLALEKDRSCVRNYPDDAWSGNDAP